MKRLISFEFTPLSKLEQIRESRAFSPKMDDRTVSKAMTQEDTFILEKVALSTTHLADAIKIVNHLDSYISDNAEFSSDSWTEEELYRKGYSIIKNYLEFDEDENINQCITVLFFNKRYTAVADYNISYNQHMQIQNIRILLAIYFQHTLQNSCLLNNMKRFDFSPTSFTFTNREGNQVLFLTIKEGSEI